MWFMLLAAGTGVAAGVLTGGRLRRIGAADFRLWSLLISGLVLQAASAIVEGASSTFLLVASYVALVGFGVANAQLVGMAVVAIGMAANALVIGVNAGMPVRADAIVAAGLAERDEIDEIDFGRKRHLASDEDELVFLADILPVAPTREVLSFGDLIIGVGLADVVFHLMRRRDRRRVPDAVIQLTSRGPAQQER